MFTATYALTIPATYAIFRPGVSQANELSYSQPAKPAQIAVSSLEVRYQSTRAAFLHGHLHPQWRFALPLQVLVHQDETGCTYVSEDTFAVYGYGDNVSEAQQDYVSSLIDLYYLLQDRSREDKATRALFVRLQHYLKPLEG